MLQIIIPASEQWDEINNEFVYTKERTLQLEHSLVSISKWESRWNKSFLSKPDKTSEESLDYIRCMTLTQNVDQSTYNCLTKENIDQINKYINLSMTATTFNNKKNNSGREQITSELIYYWMVTLNIPFECQKWHLNRLFTLIQVCNVKNGPTKNMSQREIMSQNATLNASRRKQFNTRG